MTAPIPRPDWVIVGTPTGDGQVAVFASRSLTEAQLVTETERYRYQQGPFLLNRTHSLHVVMKDYVLVVADDYRSAMRGVFETWQPDEPVQERPALGAAVPPAIRGI